MANEVPCTFCGRVPKDAALLLRDLDAVTCRPCATRLGELVARTPWQLVRVWPAIVDEDGEDPEPRVRRSDGSTVELKSLTAELKRDLTLEQRVELAQTLGSLGLWREQLLECAFVLAAEAPLPLAQRALDLMFLEVSAATAPLDVLRQHLLPS